MRAKQSPFVISSYICFHDPIKTFFVKKDQTTIIFCCFFVPWTETLTLFFSNLSKLDFDFLSGRSPVSPRVPNMLMKTFALVPAPRLSPVYTVTSYGTTENIPTHIYHRRYFLLFIFKFLNTYAESSWWIMFDYFTVKHQYQSIKKDIWYRHSIEVKACCWVNIIAFSSVPYNF